MTGPGWAQRELSGAHPAELRRWGELIGARDPAPDAFCGTGGMASWSRMLGQPVEEELRKVPGLTWWFDPELPLREVAGLGTWRTDGRGEETAEQFAGLVSDYAAALRAGSAFPPLFISAVWPAADLPVLGDSAFMDYAEGYRRLDPFYVVRNGRHRAAAAAQCGMRTFPAFVFGPGCAFAPLVKMFGPHLLARAGAAARDRGRRGVPLEAIGGRTLRRVS